VHEVVSFILENMSKKNPRKASQPPVSMGGIVKEGLPLPFVHYPNHYGTFFTFSKKQDSEPYLCECAKAAINNYFRLRKKVEVEDTNWYFDQASHLDKLHFPNSIQIASHINHEYPLKSLRFGKGLCHRCSLVPPTMRYCHKMYGVKFIQYFGWYVDQAYLRFGILPRGIVYLEDLTPEDLAEDIIKIKKTRSVFREASIWFREREEYIYQRINDPSLPELEFNEEEISFHQDILRDANKEVRRAERKLSKKIENIVRQEFGFRKVGERWTSETILYQIVCNLFPKAKVIHHHRPDWLGGLELDIFLPSENLAFEYQGQQHFHPIEAWGGEDALRELQERDKKKKILCDLQHIKLITIDYTDSLIPEYIRERVNQ
jgi:hypothetical protein